MSSCKRLALALTFFVMSSTATPSFAAGPSSLNYATRTGFSFMDLHRIEALADALSLVGESLWDYLISMDTEACHLSVSCASAAVQYIGRINYLSIDLATKVRDMRLAGTDLDSGMAAIRITHIDEIARLQYDFLQALPGAGHDPASTTGNGLGDIQCRDYFAIYWMLMTRVVDYPREAGLGGGRGTDD